ncbi:MAG: DUF429 domain-containing protein [Saprospiraceae bacterium]|nr:DUF429 domain-containing protein [Saprospiraceae bacterium]
METLKPIVGIDYGARKAGTTALAVKRGSRIDLLACLKGADADQWILDHLLTIQPRVIAIDAPLSLPSGVMGKGSQFHMRLADQLCGAMSPMFLGGLTARAMSLRYHYPDDQVTWLETYPSWTAKRRLHCTRETHTPILQAMEQLWPGSGIPSPGDQHQMDALLALMAAHHWATMMSWHFGDPREGVIVI